MKSMLAKNELKVIWNKVEKDYMKQIERIYLPTFINMCNLTNAYNKKNILNLNFCTGVSMEYLIQFNEFKGETKIYGADMNEKMLLEAYYRLNSIKNKNLSVNLNLQKKDSSIILSRKVNFFDNFLHHDRNLPSINVQLQDSDYEKLTFEDKEFDIILSNMSLHGSKNPEKEVSELSRVMKKDGIAAISIMGGKENEGCLSIVPNLLEKYVKKDSDMKNPYMDLGKLKTLALNNGFKTFNYCTTFAPFSLFSSNEDFSVLMEVPKVKEALEKLDKNTKTKLIEELKSEIQEKMGKEGKILTQEILILLLQK